MDEVTNEDRKAELRRLLDQIEAHPEREWKQERKRIAVLQNLLAAHEAASED